MPSFPAFYIVYQFNLAKQKNRCVFFVKEKEDRNMGFCAIFMKPSVDISECRCYNLVK